MAIPLRSLSLAAEPRTTGVILAIDYGKKRLGLALSDAFGITSRPYATWNRVNRRRDLARLRELVRDESVRRIIVGLPLHLDGSPSEMSEEARSFRSSPFIDGPSPTKVATFLNSDQSTDNLRPELSTKRSQASLSIFFWIFFSKKLDQRGHSRS